MNNDVLATHELTIALIKPDALARRISHLMYGAIEAQADIVVLEIRKFTFSLAAARRFYGRQHEGKPYFEELVQFMASGPSIAMCLGGEGVISRWREMMGPTRHQDQQIWQLRSIWRDVRPEARLMENLVHGSDSRESYLHEAACLGWEHVR